MGADGRPCWPDAPERPDIRIYTIRAIDVSPGEIDIDFVMHEGDDMPGARFAAEARPGDVIGMTGPGGGSAAAADWYLLAGDETALPAIGRILEGLPRQAKAVVRIEVADEGERQDLRSVADVDLQWLFRNGAPAGTTEALAEAIRTVALPRDGRSIFVWTGCEHACFRRTRKYLREECGLARDEHLVVAYWRRGYSGDAARKGRKLTAAHGAASSRNDPTLLRIYRPWKGLFLLDFTCAVISGLLELGFPIAVKWFIDQLLPTQQWGLILLASLGLLALYVANTGLMAVVVYWGHMLGINIETEMRRKSFDHLQKLSFAFYDNNKTGHLVARVTKDLEEIGEVAHHGPEDLFIAVMTFVGAFALMLTVNPKLALITAAVVPLVAWVTSRYGARMTRNWQMLYRSVGDFNVRLEENIGGMRVVQAFGNEDYERDLFARDNWNYRKTKLAAYRIMAASMSLSYLSMRLIQLIVMIAGSYFVLTGELSNGGFVSFLLLVGVFFRPIDKINSVIETYPKGFAGFQRYLDLLDTQPDITDRPGARTVKDLRGEIRFRDVTFGYAGGRPVLDGVNLDLKAGETVAFVGPSGAGKTTLCSLIPRFYEIDGGSIQIDGIDIRDMTLASLRSQIGIVQQDVFLFIGTIRENIPTAGATPRRRHRPGREARPSRQADRGLPDGLDTVIGERGVKLSGGQKQRLAIARMFLKTRRSSFGRGHVGARHRDRAGDPAFAGRARAGSHHAGDRAPARHDRACRPHRRAEPRQGSFEQGVPRHAHQEVGRCTGAARHPRLRRPVLPVQRKVRGMAKAWREPPSRRQAGRGHRRRADHAERRAVEPGSPEER